MSRPDLLTEEAIRNNLGLLPLWESNGKSIKRTCVLHDFVSAIGFINAIAIHAEAMDHHPEIHLYGWNKVDVTISTHDKGGLTQLDMDLASKIDAITM